MTLLLVLLEGSGRFERRYILRQLLDYKCSLSENIVLADVARDTVTMLEPGTRRSLISKACL